MKLRPLTLVALSFVVGMALASKTQRIWWVPLTLSVGLAGVLHYYWQGLRDAVRNAYSRPLRWRWINEPADLGEDGAQADAEWRGLGYTLLGTLQGEDENGGLSTNAVYAHPELPVYVRVWQQRNPAGKSRLAAQMVSFFPEHGRLSTTSFPGIGLFTAGVSSPGPRLIQYRYWGTPTALDGQHLGTLQAWMAGKRQPLPATREALPGYLEDDFAWMRETLEASGWLPLGLYVQSLFRKPKGTLTW